MLNSNPLTAEEMLFSQNIPYSFPDPVYRYELLLMGTPLDTQSTGVNDRPTICAVCPVSTSPPPPLSPPPLQAATLYSIKWYKIPQTPYHLKRWDFTQSDPILFRSEGFPGVSMRDALRKKFTDLRGRDDLVLQNVGIAISFRLWVCSLY